MNDEEKAIRVLYVEDDDGLARLLQRRLSRHGFEIEIVTNGEEAIERLRTASYDAVLLDYTLPTMNGLDILKILAPVDGEPPVIMLTAGGNEQLAVEALQLGAEDYLVKDVGQTYLDLLPHVLNAAILKLNLRKQTMSQGQELRFYIAELETRNADLHQEIEERRKLEEALRDAKDRAEAASVAKSEFLANMSHEIRTPMNAVVGLSNILVREPLTDRQKEFVMTLQQSADALLALIDDLLDISKIEARSIDLEHIPFSLAQVLREISGIISVRAKERNIGFFIEDRRSDDRMYMGDPTRLRQILLNLCSNGVKFTDTGHVKIIVEARHRAADIDEVTIVVEDTGIGIPPGQQEGIFAKFVQADSSINRKYGGTGLGLAITKALTEILGGDIGVESAPGEGSRFILQFPLQLAEPWSGGSEKSDMDQVAGPVEEEKPIILVVEDYAPNVLVVGFFLEDFGYRFDVASNGAEALEKIRQNRYAAVLMDVQMHMMNGLEATRLVRLHEREMGKQRVPIIGMTAHALSGDRERCLDSGMDDYISKPFNPVEFQEKLRSLLSSDGNEPVQAPWLS